MNHFFQPMLDVLQDFMPIIGVLLAFCVIRLISKLTDLFD